MAREVSEPRLRIGRHPLPSDFRLDSGETELIERELPYSLVGSTGGPLVVVAGGISADRFVSETPTGDAGWWAEIVGPGKAIDTRSHRVLGFDWLGSRLVGAQSAAPRYPLVSTRDQARALSHLLDALGVPRVDAFVGSSYGGMVGLAFAADHPERLARLVVLSAAHRTHPMATAHRAIQRGCVDLAEDAGRGLALARSLAMTTYRTSGEFEARFGVEPISGSRGRFEVEQYLDAQGEKFRGRFDPRAFQCLSHSIDLHYVDPRRVTVPTTLLSVDTDELVPTWLVNELEQALPLECHHHRLPSPFGHDAFLKEPEAISALLSNILPPEVTPR